MKATSIYYFIFIFNYTLFSRLNHFLVFIYFKSQIEVTSKILMSEIYNI